MSVDIAINGYGFYSITGLTGLGTAWIDQNVGDADRGMAHCDDQNLVRDIADGADGEGLVVAFNGVQYGAFSEITQIDAA